ncbi:MAG: hypothetical protein FJ264_16300 [Planctomycetes bacterium]|nr:hypothetical protein [Planctomycetota bacterium]
MDPICLVKDGEKYCDEYVATKSLFDNTVVAHGKDAVKVYNEAKQKGFKDPVIFHVPEDILQIY